MTVLLQEVDGAVCHPGAPVMFFRYYRHLRLVIKEVSDTMNLTDMPIPNSVEIGEILIFLTAFRDFLHQLGDC